MDKAVRLEKKTSIPSSSMTIKKIDLTKKISKRRSYLIKTNVFKERHGIIMNHYNRLHRNYFDRQKKVRICQSNQDTSSLAAGSIVSTNHTENKFYNILNPEHKIYIDQKMENHKDVSPEEIITKARKVALEGQLYICKLKGKLMLKKGFGQKYIAPFVKDLNPIQDVRLSDYIFPLDSSLYKDDSHLDNSMIFDQFKIKRATQLTFDPKDSFYRAKIEERYPTTEEFLGYNIINYYVKWLDSLCNYRANKLKESLEQYIKNTLCSNNQVEKAIDKKVSSSEQQLHNQKRFYLAKLSDETRNYIIDRPAIVRCNRLDCRSSQKILYEFRVNQKWANMTGLNSINLIDFNCQNMATALLQSMITDNYIVLYSKILFDISSCATEMVSTDRCVVIPNDQLYCKNNMGEKIHGTMKIFREVYLKDDLLNYVSYFVYDQS